MTKWKTINPLKYYNAPKCDAVYLLFDKNESLFYIGRSANIQNRIRQWSYNYDIKHIKFKTMDRYDSMIFEKKLIRRLRGSNPLLNFYPLCKNHAI